jgi:hypothetical protein
MLNYTEPPVYKRDTRVIHFILIGICLLVVAFGALVYFC